MQWICRAANLDNNLFLTKSNIMKRLTFTFLVLMLALSGYGQRLFEYYTFFQRSCNYVHLTYGTEGYADGDYDNNTLYGVPIGFTFNYNGQNYTSLNISTNGAIRFGNYVTVSYVNDLSSTNDVDVIAPLWDDLFIRNTYNGKIIYNTFGSMPNRKFVVEWQNICWRENNETVSFKVILYEGTNNIEFQYGPSNLHYTRSATIGMNQSGTSFTDFLSITPGDYATVSAAISDNNISTDNYPGDGVSYQFKHKTWVPDDNLEQAMIDKGWDTTLDNYVLTYNIKHDTIFLLTEKDIYLSNGIEDMKMLKHLNINKNNLIALNNLDNRYLKSLDCSYNNSLKNVKVDKLPQLMRLEAQFCDISSIDLSKNPLLKRLFMWKNSLTSLDISSNLQLEDVNVHDNELGVLTTGNNSQITSFKVDGNNLTVLDISKMTNLATLWCSSNDISVLEPNSPALKTINCSHTKIESIDLTQMGFAASEIIISLSYNPNLTHIDMRNQVNSVVTSFNATECPQLTCIYVDDVSASYLWNWKKSAGAHFVSNDTECDNYRLTHVPDANFEHYLETHNSIGQIVAVGASNSMGNGIDNDGLVYTSAIETVTELDVQNQNISDLTGIEDFAALSNLNCGYNDLSELDISQNTQLQTLYCYYNNLTRLDLSQNSNLNILGCSNNIINTLVLNGNRIRLFNVSNNHLTSLDLTQLTHLAYVDCSHNQLGSMDVRNGANSTITNFSANNNSNLSCIYVDDPSYSQSNWTYNIDAGAYFVANETECENLTLNTYVPDDNFEQALIDLGYDSAPLDDYVPTSAIDTIQSLLIYNKNISDLTGIEDFVSLKTLNISRNQLTSVDLRYNTLLEILFVSNNNISELNLLYNTHLKRLFCNDNQLTFLYLNSPDLWDLNYSNNQLTDVDMTRSSGVTDLKCSNNQLTSFDIHILHSLKNLYADNNQLTGINLSQNTELVLVNLSHNNITGLDISALSKLYTLNVEYNNLTKLDISQNPVLAELDFGSNRVSEFIIGGVTTLENLYCEGNLLTELDVSNQTGMLELGCNYNQIESLDVRNGNNTNMYEFNAQDNDLGCIYVDDVAWAQANWSGKINGDAHFVADEDECATYNKTYVPDDNLEQALIDLGYDSGELDDYVPTENIRTVSELDISNRNIEDLTGLEDFTALSYLNCSMNNIRSLYTPASSNGRYGLEYLNISGNDFRNNIVDLNNFTRLETVIASSANIARLDFGNLSDLTILMCNDNNISNIEVNGNLKLKSINVADNQLSSIVVTALDGLQSLKINGNNIGTVDITNQKNLLIFNARDNAITNDFDFSKNPFLQIINIKNNSVHRLVLTDNSALELLDCSGNLLEELDLSGCDSIKHIICENNFLKHLDITSNTAVENLLCSNNKLVSLDARNGNNSKIVNFIAVNNPDLSCIYVDDPDWSNNNWSVGINGNEHFVADEAECTASGVDDNVESELSVYPVPVTNVLHINIGFQKHVDVYLYDNLGRIIDSERSETGMVEFNMSGLPTASYVVKIVVENKEVFNKIVIKR